MMSYTMKLYKKEKTYWNKIIYFIEIYNFIKNFTICVTRMRDEVQTQQPLSPTTTHWLGKHHTVHIRQF